MLYYALKVIISAIVIVAIAEIAKRNTGLAALVASLPLTSLLAFIWLHIEGAAVSQIADLSKQIFWFHQMNHWIPLLKRQKQMKL